MKVALIGDVHANLPALEAVLADAKARGAEAVWNVGDFVGYGAFPDQVVRLLRSEDAVSIVGNYDRKVLRFPARRRAWRQSKAPDKFLAFEWAHRNLSPDSREYLASLPRERRLTVGGRRVLLTHGSPASEDEPLTDETPPRRLGELAELARADVVICGHSHRPLRREAGAVLFIGTGSVGRPEGGDPRACYALLEIDGHGLSVRHRRVAYDTGGAADAIRGRDLPEAFAEMVLRGESYDGVARPGAAGAVEGRDSAREDAVAAVLALCRRCDAEMPHTRQVTRLALRLFDELRPLHGLGDVERFHLRCAALLHDIGWIDGQKAHHKSASRRILADRALPFDDRVRRIVAAVARYHRKALPKPGHEPYTALDAADRRRVDVLAGMLRVADGLDRSHRDVVADVSCQTSPGKLTISCLGEPPAEAEMWAAGKKADLLEQTLGRTVTFELAPAGRSQAAGPPRR